MRILSHGCTLDCYDCCKFNVHVENGNIVKIEGDTNHPYTKGFICEKGRKHLERLQHKDRVLSPMKKEKGKWSEIDFGEAIEIIAERLKYYRGKYGSHSVLHYFESGSGGISKSIQDIFFNFYGGITLPKGSTCWGAGIAAQRYDFGDVRGHTLDDMLNSRNIVLWGRNPANTSIHLMNMVKKARRNGSKIIVIDPIYTDAAKISDFYVRVNPSTDGALAMAITKVVLEKGKADLKFLTHHVEGFEEYVKYLNTLALDYLLNETGVDINTVNELAQAYSVQRPTATFPGYGLQKHRNGGNTIRAIDALAAITGNIGAKGGGVNYANFVYPAFLDKDPYDSEKHAVNNRYFDVSNFSEFLAQEETPPIKAIFVSKANPLNQFPDLNKAVKAFNNVEFKVCFDMFMTDTAKHCDLFIPCTNTLETEDLVLTSMSNPYIIYNEKVVDPKHPLMDEYLFFRSLAEEMDMIMYPKVSKKEYLQKVIEPLEEVGVNIEKIKREPVTIQRESVAWSDYNFKTPTQKFEIYSEKAETDGLSPMPVYEKNKSGGIGRLRLITSHPRESLFSQHYIDVEGVSQAYLNKGEAQKFDLVEGEIVRLISEKGQIKVQIRFSETVSDGIVHMYIGWWEKHGNPNFLTDNICSDMGGQIAYYDTFVDIEKETSSQ